ncbi:probable mitochondrial adenine nucleotide transporter BTL3 [Dioscorea cayenensis subsp. rotundata]|uniref:Probable mitochondrial adenine nucleotide transporter BTL3 n=1 Tax=Dioscorea cayennensis subsp. rotundata TaxID=55577 RepID=A0AB40AXH8_DIOCR|nr:probable mitochondrial adenine nucleotide transporter BTL3 [Dioscorea cayenensis subsp. rotundata]XP_039119534.1 probable mitochondrial adenine nucleotide transporter BTL3 [Dioscorea cayenensis subsp. rotundata]
MHHSESMSTFHKYFPSLSLDKDEDVPFPSESPQVLFQQSFSSNHLAAKILQPDDEFPSLASLSLTKVAKVRAFRNFLSNLNKTKASGVGKGGPKHSWSDMPKFLLAGAVSTVLSRTCIAPLERIKLECIVQGSKHSWIEIIKCIWVSEGLKGFWKGNMLNLFRMVPFKSINFICYDMYLDCLLSMPEKKEITNHDRLIGGGISGVTATIFCLPLDTIRTRLAAPGGDALGGVAGCFYHMMHNEGFLSLYKGLTPALISIGPASAVFYAVYDILKTSYLLHGKQRGSEKDIGIARTLLYGAIAGACAETVTYPLEVIRRQLQLQQSRSLGLGPAFIKMIQREGVSSLFTGLIPSTLQVLPSASLSYLFYETMKSVLKIS